MADEVEFGRASSPETAAVVRYEDTPTADEDRAWDGAAAVDRMRRWASSDGSGDKDTMDWPKYRRGFTWYDAEAPDNFGSYKLPHHDVDDGRLVAVWRGVAAAMAVVHGGRGGPDIPDEDLRPAHNHLARHYRQFDREPPEPPGAEANAAAIQHFLRCTEV